jgi:hypothetical protein
MFWICSIWLLQIDVNGKNTAPVYKFWKSEKGGYFGVAIKWNFTKSLVNKVGKVVERCAPTTSPLKIEVRSFVFLLQHLSLKNFCELHLTFLHSILQKDIQNLLGSSQGTKVWWLHLRVKLYFSCQLTMISLFFCYPRIRQQNFGARAALP